MDANVTCRMLGYLLYSVKKKMIPYKIDFRFPGALKRTFGSQFGNVPENFLISHVNCSGHEDSLLDCKHQDGEDCRSCMAAGVVCKEGRKLS